MYKKYMYRTQHLILWMTKKTMLEKIKIKHLQESLQLKIGKNNCCSMLRRLIPHPCHAKPIITPKGIITVMPSLKLEYVC